MDKNKEKKFVNIDFSSLDKGIADFVFTIKDKEIGYNTTKDNKNSKTNIPLSQRPKKKLNVELIKQLIKETKENQIKQQAKNEKKNNKNKQ